MQEFMSAIFLNPRIFHIFGPGAKKKLVEEGNVAWGNVRQVNLPFLEGIHDGSYGPPALAELFPLLLFPFGPDFL
jgi:hypothetical protein